MSATVRALRFVAGSAALAGYVFAKASESVRAIWAMLLPQIGWRTVDAAGVRLRVPRDWGELERDADGVLVVHNRPRRFRIDGDAVWYSSAIELRVFRGDRVAPRNAEAMTVTRRLVMLRDGAATLELAVANGAGPRRRALAERVLWSAKPVSARPAARESRLEITGT
jgi:hypothetical protein